MNTVTNNSRSHQTEKRERERDITPSSPSSQTSSTFDYEVFVSECLESNPFDKNLHEFDLFKPNEVSIKEDFNKYVEVKNAADVNKIVLGKYPSISRLREADKKKLPFCVFCELREVKEKNYLQARKKLLKAYNKNYIRGVL